MENNVYLKQNIGYDVDKISSYLNTLPVFNCIKPGNQVLLKPNWVHQHHQYKMNDWDYVITHPDIITAVINIVIEKLEKIGRIIITDGPMTSASFNKLLELMPVDRWNKMANASGIALDIIDLRDEEWHAINGIILKKRLLPGDPRGSVEVNLKGEHSEFNNKKLSPKGYFGASNDTTEVNRAHAGHNNIYRVSRSVIESDVFINIPKMKTHKKAGITCSLKNIVGINTYKNYLPHHSIGTPDQGGDQYNTDSRSTKLENGIVYYAKKFMNRINALSFLFVFLKKAALIIFGESSSVIRAGSWFGNDTLWRTILDLNKILLYAEPDGSMRKDDPHKRKMYISVVDGVLAGQGEGPINPEIVHAGMILCGTNPVAVDCCCAKLMGFDYSKIPSILYSLDIDYYKLFTFNYNDINLFFDNTCSSMPLANIKNEICYNFNPSIGWKGNIEL